MALAAYGSRLKVLTWSSGEQLFSAQGSTLAYSPDGRWLVRAKRI